VAVDRVGALAVTPGMFGHDGVPAAGLVAAGKGPAPPGEVAGVACAGHDGLGDGCGVVCAG
jgi:hypothetical protein